MARARTTTTRQKPTNALGLPSPGSKPIRPAPPRSHGASSPSNQVSGGRAAPNTAEWNFPTNFSGPGRRAPTPTGRQNPGLAQGRKAGYGAPGSQGQTSTKPENLMTNVGPYGSYVTGSKINAAGNPVADYSTIQDFNPNLPAISQIDPNQIPELLARTEHIFATNESAAQGFDLTRAHAYGLTPDEALALSALAGGDTFISPDMLPNIYAGQQAANKAYNGGEVFDPAAAGAPPEGGVDLNQQLVDQMAVMSQNFDAQLAAMQEQLNNQPDINELMPYLMAALGGGNREDENTSPYYF